MSGYELDDLRRSQDRDYAAEGIPMLLALRSEVADIPEPALPGAGPELAETLSRYRAALAPSQPDSDLGVVISVLQAAAYADFDPGRIGRA